jgi:hypothetical protein
MLLAKTSPSVSPDQNVRSVPRRPSFDPCSNAPRRWPGEYARSSTGMPCRESSCCQGRQDHSIHTACAGVRIRSAQTSVLAPFEYARAVHRRVKSSLRTKRIGALLTAAAQSAALLSARVRPLEPQVTTKGARHCAIRSASFTSTTVTARSAGARRPAAELVPRIDEFVPGPRRLK